MRLRYACVPRTYAKTERYGRAGINYKTVLRRRTNSVQRAHGGGSQSFATRRRRRRRHNIGTFGFRAVDKTGKTIAISTTAAAGVVNSRTG